MLKHIILTTTLMLSSSAILAHGKHIHGEGHLELAIDRGSVSIHLTLPLEVAVGFERQPRNEKEKAALATAEKALKNATTLWALTPAATCRVDSVQLNLPEFEGTHADIEARYLFQCSNPDKLDTLASTLFKSFKRLYRIEAQYIGPNGQGATRMTPKNPLIRW